MKDYSLQGKVWLGTRLASGKAGALKWLGDNSELTLKLTTEKSERIESWSGNRLTSAVLQKAKKVEITLKPNQLSSNVLALALYGTVATIAAGTVTGEALPAGLKPGDTVVLDKANASAVALTDSTATPKTLVLGTDYAIESAAASLLTIKSTLTPTYVEPIKAAYSNAAGVDLTMFTEAVPERYLVFDGINTLTNERLLVRLYRCQIDPVSDLALITPDLGELSMGGNVLFDATNAADTKLGGFGKISLPTEV